LVSGRGRVVQWNARNKPVQINGAQYVYDGEGLRLKKVTGSVATLTPVGGAFEVTGGVATKYATLPGLGLVAKRVGATPYWLHADRLGSIQAITDATGAAVQSTTYRPYGEKVTEATAHEESRGYIGEIQDDDTGLSYLNARYYDPEVGLFLSPDVLSPVEPGVGPNRYAYTAGNPIDWSDPSGMAANQLCGTQFGDREDCQDGAGYTFVLGGGIVYFDGGTGNRAVDEMLALEDRFFATQPVTQVLSDGTTMVVTRDRDGGMTVTLIDADGQVLSSNSDATYSETSGGCREAGGVRCRTFGTLVATGAAEPFDWMQCAAGVCDGLSFGLGPILRDALGTDPDGLVDTDSPSYLAGELVGTAGSVALTAGAAVNAAGLRVVLWRYPRAGGGGINVLRGTTRVIGFDWHRFKSGGRMVFRPHIDVPAWRWKHWPWPK
jgi:RHS repeat-associated protein